MASFLVPLNFNKFDLKDYLFNVYNVPVLAVRSFIKQQSVSMDKPYAENPKPRRWYRGRGTKVMTVEIADEYSGGPGPFVWPDPPEDLAE